MFDIAENASEATYHELHRSHPSSAGVDVIASTSAAERLHPLDSQTHRSMLATPTDAGRRAPGSGPLVPGYQDSCGDQRVRGCGVGGGVTGTVGPQAVETW